VTLSDLPVGGSARIEGVSGERTFRRRLLELGLLPGTQVRMLRVAPLGDPLELWARGANLSIRRQEAQLITISLEESK
jgi:ferrous iron transport protein A